MCEDSASLRWVTCAIWLVRMLGASLVEESFTRSIEFSEAASRIADMMSALLAKIKHPN